jgi:hypothetical protein
LKANLWLADNQPGCQTSLIIADSNEAFPKFQLFGEASLNLMGKSGLVTVFSSQTYHKQNLCTNRVLGLA